MWQIGSARTDITPPVGIWQAGFGARTSPSTGVHIPLHTTALAIGDGTRKAAICMNDLVGLSRPEIERIRALAAERCDGLDPGDILVCCTHTHSGPAVSTYLRGQPKDLGYIEWLCGAIAHTIVEVRHCIARRVASRASTTTGAMRAATARSAWRGSRRGTRMGE